MHGGNFSCFQGENPPCGKKKNYLIWLTCQARTENDRNSNLTKFADDKKIQLCILAQSLSMIAMNTSVLRANLLGNDRRRELCFDLQ